VTADQLLCGDEHPVIVVTMSGRDVEAFAGVIRQMRPVGHIARQRPPGAP